MARLQIVLLFFTAFTLLTTSDSIDPWDLTVLTKGAAIGDSYAAGIGAGNRLDWACSRYDGSYSNLVVSQLGVDPKVMDFTYTACSGAVISEVGDQADKLSDSQQFIIISAGGNDAYLVDILNLCVYSFWSLAFIASGCDQKLTESANKIKSAQFASDLDTLMNKAKSKLGAGGDIYYVGYAKFFDTSDNSCDTTSWHYFVNLFTRQYLTLARRESMNSLVDSMNDALRNAVTRAGPQVHFIDYDEYVGMTFGRFCQPGTDESNGESANRDGLFFYELDSGYTSPHEELKRRSDSSDDGANVQPVNDTLNALYGAMLQNALIQDHGLAIIELDNSNPDLDAEVNDFEKDLVSRNDNGEAIRSPYIASPRIFSRNHKRGNVVPVGSWNSTINDSTYLNGLASSAAPAGLLPSSSKIHPSGSGYASASGLSAVSVSSNHDQGYQGTVYPVGAIIPLGSLSHAAYATNTSRNISTAAMPRGIVLANSTHVMLSQDRVALKSVIQKLFVGDGTARVFHPTQGGHELIANLILYRMAANNAKAHGITGIPPEVLNSTGSDWPQIGGAACTAITSDTWSDRDSMIAALNSFCADPHNMKGSKGALTSATFNANTLNYMNVSIMWDNEGAIGEHSCSAWLDVVTDGCSVPIQGSNAQNLKHGGTIAYQSDVVNASLNIIPLVVRQIWDKGQAGGQHCSSVNTQTYLDQATLQANVDDYCKLSVAQPNGIAVSGSTFSKIFNDGTPDRVSISTTWPPGLRDYQIFEDECRYYLSVLTNGCSLPSNNNPMNWKHGGSMSDNNGIKYTITPTVTRQVPPTKPYGICPVVFHYWGYTWDIFGAGFADSDYGARLLSEIRKTCSNVWGWTFDYSPGVAVQSTGYEWHASGGISLFVSKTCLANAIKNAGGFAGTC